MWGLRTSTTNSFLIQHQLSARKMCKLMNHMTNTDAVAPSGAEHQLLLRGKLLADCPAGSTVAVRQLARCTAAGRTARCAEHQHQLHLPTAAATTSTCCCLPHWKCVANDSCSAADSCGAGKGVWSEPVFAHKGGHCLPAVPVPWCPIEPTACI